MTDVARWFLAAGGGDFQSPTKHKVVDLSWDSMECHWGM